MANGNSPEIHFFNSGVKINLEQKNNLRLFIQSIFKREKKTLSQLNYIFCTDRKLLEINRAYLKHDFYTDIITFDLSEKGGSVNAEIYISIDRVKENAKSLNQTIKRELHRVIFHGALHLCGYKDKKATEIKEMRKKEDFYLKKYFS